ncbi:MAG: hypothetical protein KJ062_08565 [Thermoanaerobaculia bacterium]|nr:hypothetical protein [Thermoanaerobaculia bacterium]
MRLRRAGRPFVLVAAIAFFPGAAPAVGIDVDALVLEAAVRQREGEVSAGRVTLERVEVENDHHPKGGVKKLTRRRYAVVMDARGLVGRELLEVDGREATEAEREKSRRDDAKRRRAAIEADGARSDEEELVSGRVPLLDLYHRLRFRIVGEELLDGRPTWVIEFRPKPGLVSKTIRDRVLNSFSGTTWVDVAEHQLRKIDGRLTTPVKVLGGVRLVYETREVMPGTWAPCREEIGISATAGMLLGFRREIRFEFGNYRSARHDLALGAAR